MTTGKRLGSVGIENTEDNRRDWRQLLYTAPGLGQYISGCIMFEETLYQSTREGKQFVDVLSGEGIVPGIKVSPHTITPSLAYVNHRRHDSWGKVWLLFDEAFGETELD